MTELILEVDGHICVAIIVPAATVFVAVLSIRLRKMCDLIDSPKLVVNDKFFPNPR